MWYMLMLFLWAIYILAMIEFIGFCTKRAVLCFKKEEYREFGMYTAMAISSLVFMVSTVIVFG